VKLVRDAQIIRRGERLLAEIVKKNRATPIAARGTGSRPA